MNKIKIFAVLLGLVGCMDNGFGMREDQSMNHVYEDDFLVVTPDNIDQLTDNREDYNWQHLKIKGIDFSSEDTYSLCVLCAMMESRSLILEFEECIFDDRVSSCFPTCLFAQKIKFLSCIGINDSNKIDVLCATRSWNENIIEFINCHK